MSEFSTSISSSEPFDYSCVSVSSSISSNNESYAELLKENKKLKEQLEKVNKLFQELRFYPLDHNDFEMMERIYEYEKEYNV